MDVPVLVCTEGALQGRVISVPEGGLKFGRADGNDIVLDDDGVSRFHAKLLYDNGSLWLQDVGSRNGVFVNDVRLTGHKALKVGDEITISEHRFTVRWQDDVESSGSTDPEEKKPSWFWPFS